MSSRRKNLTRIGKNFEVSFLKSLQSLPHSWALRQPGRALHGRYTPPNIDLSFVNSEMALSIECKATRSNVYYLSQMGKGQRKSLRRFNKKGKFFHGILAVYFVKSRKVVLTDNMKDVKVTSQDEGIKRIKGLWDVGYIIKRYSRK